MPSKSQLKLIAILVLSFGFILLIIFSTQMTGFQKGMADATNEVSCEENSNQLIMDERQCTSIGGTPPPCKI
jgi:ABC-type lipoprotein release transport system permease subunit